MFGKDKQNKDNNTSPAPAAAPAPAPKAETPVQIPSMTNYISSGTVVEGNIISHEDFHMDGTVKGDIKTSAKLILGKDSVVEGNILASEAEVSGRITGTVESKGLLAIRSTCVIEGDIVTKSLNVESGSSFNGRCKVGDAAEAKETGVNRVKAAAPQSPVPSKS